MNQQHAVLVQPDLTGLCTKMYTRAQIVAVCARDATELDHGLALLPGTIGGFRDTIGFDLDQTKTILALDFLASEDL
ncbi:MAG: hypothetical protein ACTS6J_14350, partial [Burkholderiales bacterium]